MIARYVQFTVEHTPGDLFCMTVCTIVATINIGLRPTFLSCRNCLTTYVVIAEIDLMLWCRICFAITVLAGIVDFVVSIILLAVDDKSWHMCSLPQLSSYTLQRRSSVCFPSPHSLSSFRDSIITDWSYKQVGLKRTCHILWSYVLQYADESKIITTSV